MEDSQMHPHEQAFVEAFVEPSRRDRTTFCLSHPKKRHEFVNKLAHHGKDVLITQFFRAIEPSQQNPQAIHDLLRRLGAPSTCHVISSSAEDGLDMELLEALERVIGYGNGAVISCIPGRLAYFEGEWRERYILQNHGSAKQ